MLMSQRSFVACGAFVIVLLSLFVSTSDAAQSVEVPQSWKGRFVGMNQSGRVPGKYLIKFRTEMDLASLRTRGLGSRLIRADLEPTKGEGSRQLGMVLAQLAGGQLTNVLSAAHEQAVEVSGVTEDRLRYLVDDVRIEYIEPVLKVEPLSTSQNVSGFPNRWFLTRISQRNPVRVGYGTNYVYDVNGSGVRVYVIDTGIRVSHQEFEGRAGTFVYDCTVFTVSGECGFKRTSPSATFCRTHGTEVASVIGGREVGVAKNVSILGFIVGYGPPLSGTGCSAGPDTSYVKKAIDWIVDHEKEKWNGPQVINMSLAVFGTSSALEASVQRAINAGIVFVAGSGNDPVDPCQGSSARSPVRMSSVLTIGGTISANGSGSSVYDGVAVNFGRGACVDLFAPSEFIAVADASNDTGYDGNGLQGTSYSTAIASGIASLYLQTHAHETPAQVSSAMGSIATSNKLYVTGSCGTWVGCAPVLGGTAGAPNRIAYSLVPVGSDNAIGGAPPSITDRVRAAINSAIQLLLSD